jgi:hypothetical protein
MMDNEDMARAIDSELLDGSDIPEWEKIGLHLTDKDIDGVLDDIDSGVYDNRHMDQILALRECIKRDFDLVKLDRPLEIAPKIYDLIFLILTPDEFKQIKDFYKGIFHHGEPSKLGRVLNHFWTRVLKGVDSLVDLKENIARNWDIDFEYSVNGIPLKNADILHIITNKGISKRRITYTGTNKVPVTTEFPTWEWDSFRLLQVLKDKSDTEVVYRYNYEFNGDFFQDKSLEYMRESIFVAHCKSTGKDKQIFGPLIQEYQKKGRIPIMDYTPVWGFTREGWRMPDQYYIKFTPVQAKIRRCAYKMIQLKTTTAEAQELMDELYGATTILYKDILYAHSMIMPFLYALRDYTDIIPWLGLGSPNFNTGKTPAGIMITTKIWNNLERAYITKDEANAESRIGDYLTASTFGVMIDDCGDLHDNILNTLKSYITGDAGILRKSVDQTAKIDRSFTSALVMSYNKTPVLMDDTAFLSRGVHVPVLEVPTEAQVKRFKVIWQRIPRGYFGRYIYEKLKDLQPEDLIAEFDVIPEWSEAPYPRSNKIYKLLKLGAILFEKVFGIRLDLSQLPYLIKKTLEMGSDDIFTIVTLQIEDGRLIPYRDGYSGDVSYNFSPKRKWITAPVMVKSTKKFDGYVYTADNLTDLINRLKISQDLPALKEILAKRWPDVQYTTIKFDKRSYKCVFIPRHYLEETPDDDPDRSEHSGTLYSYVLDTKNRSLDNYEQRVMEAIANIQEELGDNPVPLKILIERFEMDGLPEQQLKFKLSGLVTDAILKEYKKKGEKFYKVI